MGKCLEAKNKTAFRTANQNFTQKSILRVHRFRLFIQSRPRLIHQCHLSHVLKMSHSQQGVLFSHSLKVFLFWSVIFHTVRRHLRWNNPHSSL